MAPEDSTAAVDPAVLARLAEEIGDVDEVVHLYLRALPLRCGSIARALASGDATALRDAAHTLRSASAFVGATTVSALSARLEQAALRREPLPAALGTQLAAEAHRAETELLALLRHGRQVGAEPGRSE